MRKTKLELKELEKKEISKKLDEAIKQLEDSLELMKEIKSQRLSREDLLRAVQELDLIGLILRASVVKDCKR